MRNLLLWWDSVSPVDQVSQVNIETLVDIGESIKVSEILAWADASREIDEQIQAKQAGKGAAPVRQEKAKTPHGPRPNRRSLIMFMRSATL